MALRDAVGGGVGSVCCTYAGIPFDTVKLRMQMQRQGALQVGCFRVALGMARHEGLRTFFRGSTPALASAFVENTVLFAAHGVLGRLLQPLRHAEPGGGGGARVQGIAISCVQHGTAGFCSSTAICAPEVVKVRLQNSTKPMSATAAADTCVELLRSEGVQGFFRGLVPLWCRDVPFYIVFFGTYEAGSALCSNYLLMQQQASGTATSPEQQQQQQQQPTRELPPLPAFLCGGLAGSVSWAVVFPFDVVKSRQQVTTVSARPTFLQTARSVEPGGFYRGVAPCVIRGFPANGALFLGVTVTQRLFRAYDESLQI